VWYYPAVPNIKAAVKWARQSEKRHDRNVETKSRLKTLFKKAKVAGSPPLVSEAESAFDKAATKGVVHPNKAARKKSRLAKAAHAAQALAAQAAAATPAGSAKAPKASAKKAAAPARKRPAAPKR